MSTPPARRLPAGRLHAHHAHPLLFETTALWRAQYCDRGRAPHRAGGRLLQIGADDPCLIVVRRTFTRDAAITIARLVHPGSRYVVEGSFTP